MIRVKRLGHSIPIGFGMGAGASLTFGDRVVGGNEIFSAILSRVVNEVTFPLDDKDEKYYLLHQLTTALLLRF